MKETLSALMDAELKAKERLEVLGKVIEDETMRAAWGRYHVMRSVLRGEWDGTLSPQFSTQVALAITNEPESGKVVPLRIPARPMRVGQMARFAIAASLTAVAALFGLRMAVVGHNTPILPLKTALVAQLAPAPAYIERAHWQGSRWRNRINAFLLEHSAVAPFAGMNGLSYVRLAAFNGSGQGARHKP